MKFLCITVLTLTIISCNSIKKPPLKIFHGIEYAVCDDFENGRIFINNIEEFSINELVEFAYCYSNEYNFVGLVIESEYYPAPSFWTGKIKGHTIFKFQFDVRDVSSSNKEVVLEKFVNLALQYKENKFVNIPKSEYNTKYSCN